MKGPQEDFLATPQSSDSSVEEQIDLALGRAYALLIRAADQARSAQQQDQEQQKNKED